VSAEVVIGGGNAAPTQAPSTVLEPVIDGGPNSFEDVPEDGGGDLDLEELREQAQKVLRGEKPKKPKAKPESKPDPPAAAEPPKPEPKAESRPEPKVAPKTEPTEPAAEPEDPDLTKRRKDVAREDGSIDDEKLSNAFAKLHSQEKRLKARVTEHAQERGAFEAERQNWQRERDAFHQERQQWQQERESRRQRAAKEPLTALEEIGWSWDQLTKYVASQGQIPIEKQIQDVRTSFDSRADTLEKENKALREAYQKAQDDHLSSQFEAKVGQEIQDLVASGKYPLASKYGVPHIVKTTLQNILGHYATTKNLLAAQHWMDQYEADLTRQRDLLVGASGQAADVESSKTPAAVKPVTNQANSERSRARVEDDGVWTEEDAEQARKAAWARLRGGA